MNVPFNDNLTVSFCLDSSTLTYEGNTLNPLSNETSKTCVDKPYIHRIPASHKELTSNPIAIEQECVIKSSTILSHHTHTKYIGHVHKYLCMIHRTCTCTTGHVHVLQGMYIYVMLRTCACITL